MTKQQQKFLLKFISYIVDLDKKGKIDDWVTLISNNSQLMEPMIPTFEFLQEGDFSKLNKIQALRVTCLLSFINPEFYKQEEEKQKIIQQKVATLLKLSKNINKVSLEDICDILAFISQNENFKNFIDNSEVKYQLQKLLQQLISDLSENEDITQVLKSFNSMKLLFAHKFNCNKYISEFTIKYIEKSDEEFDKDKALQVLEFVDQQQPLNSQLINYISEYVSEFSFQQKMKFLHIVINNNVLNSQDINRVFSELLDELDEIIKLNKNEIHFSDLVEIMRYSQDIFYPYLTLLDQNMIQQYNKVITSFINNIIDQFEQQNKNEAQQEEVVVDQLQDLNYYSLINIIYRHLLNQQKSKIQMKDVVMENKMLTFLEQNFIEGVQEFPLDIGILELLYSVLVLQRNSESHKQKYNNIFLNNLVKNIDFVYGDKVDIQKLQSELSLKNENNSQQQYQEEEVDGKDQEEQEEEQIIYYKAFRNVVTDRQLMVRIYHLYRELKWQFPQESQNEEFLKQMNFFFHNSAKIWVLPKGQNNLQTHLELQVQNAQQFMEISDIFQRFLKPNEPTDQYMMKFLKQNDYFQSSYSIFQFNEMNSVLQSLQRVHLKLLESQTRFMINIKVSEDISLQGMLNLIRQFDEFSITFKQQFNAGKNKSYIQGFYELQFLTEDIIFKNSISNYEELKKKDVKDIFETFKQQDLDSTKESWRDFKDKLQIYENIDKNDLALICELYFELCKLNLTTNRSNWIIGKILSLHFQIIPQDVKCKLLYFIGELDIHVSDQEYMVEQWIENIQQQEEKQKIDLFSAEESYHLLWYLLIKYNRNLTVLQKLVNNINKDPNNYLKLPINDLNKLYIIKKMFEIEQKQIQWNIEPKTLQIIESQFENFNFFCRSSNFSDFIKSYFDKFGYQNHQLFQKVGIFKFHITFDDNICLILDRECYRGRSKEEIGLIAIIRRYLVKQKFRMRIFEYYEWKALTRKNLKNNYLKSKMKKIEQDADSIKKKYYYNY